MNNRAGPRAPSPALRQLREASAAFDQTLVRLGWTDERLIEKLGALVDATKTLVTAKDGEFTDQIEVPDNPARQAALHTMLQLRRAYPSAKVEISGAVRIEQLHDIALRMESLPVERLAEIVEAEDAELMLTEGVGDGEVGQSRLPGL